MNLHPTIAQALRPWMPLPTLAELDEQRERIASLREKLHDEYATGLDSVDDEDSSDE